MKEFRQSALLLRALCTDLNTPVSLSVFLLAKYGEWDQISTKSVNPTHYLDDPFSAVRYFKDSQACDLLRKFPDLPLKVDRRRVAIDTFFSSEKKCFQTNKRLYRLVDNTDHSAFSCSLDPFITKVRGIVSDILGELPLRLDVRFGPGSTFESRDSTSFTQTVADKIDLGLHLTPSVLGLDSFIYESAWGRSVITSAKSSPFLVPGNRFTTVPKTSLKDRGICIEPGANVSLQLAVGRCLKKRLRHHGLNLARGEEIHRPLARSSSLNGKCATIDLTNASDTISRSLVELLLPEKWFDLLDCLRSPKTLVEGRWYLLEKFSSMGNGFTFELETLLFHALASAFYDEFIPVYGDDMIVPSRDITSFIAMLEFFGMETNRDKSYWTGPFRESCGGDYFLGMAVRPYFVKQNPSFPADWFGIHNGLLRSSLQIGVYYKNAMAFCYHQIPVVYRSIRGPSILGDIVLTDNNPLHWDSRTVNCIREITSLQPVTSRLSLSKFRPDTQMACVLYGAARTSGSLIDYLNSGKSVENYRPVTSGFLSPRASARKWKIKFVPFS